MSNAKIDENSRSSLTAVSNADGKTIVSLWADPITHRLLVDNSVMGTIVLEEIPTDSGDHINFTLAHTPLVGTFRLYRGGSRQSLLAGDFTRTGTALALTFALVSGEILIADYNY